MEIESWVTKSFIDLTRKEVEVSWLKIPFILIKADKSYLWLFCMLNLIQFSFFPGSFSTIFENFLEVLRMDGKIFEATFYHINQKSTRTSLATLRNDLFIPIIMIKFQFYRLFDCSCFKFYRAIKIHWVTREKCCHHLSDKILSRKCIIINLNYTFFWWRRWNPRQFLLVNSVDHIFTWRVDTKCQLWKFKSS